MGKEKERKGYYGWANTEEILSKSSSGGAFSAIVDKWLDKNGVVFGAAYDYDFRYVHHVACSKLDYSCMRKSKYVFCDPQSSYTECKKYLTEGRRVVFSGTPCQVAGLKRFLGKQYENLLTVDFICHGTPSIDMLNAHVDSITHGEKVKNIDFRSKAMGWRKYCLKIDMEKSTYVRSIEDDYYLNNFMKCSMLRECCYLCQYSNGNHVSDVTIADFWGIKKYNPEYTDDKGVSLIIANHEAANRFVDSLKNEMHIMPLNDDDYSYVYKEHSHYDLRAREQFLKKYKEEGWTKLSHRYSIQKPIRIIKKCTNKIIGR